MGEERHYLPSIAELIDRLVIDQLKEIKLPTNKDTYSKEIQNIVHDLNEVTEDLLLEDKIVDGDILRAVVVLAIVNTLIWENEWMVRAGVGTGDGDLKLTHRLNGVRNTAKNKILQLLGMTKGLNFKGECLADEAKDDFISW